VLWVAPVGLVRFSVRWRASKTHERLGASSGQLSLFKRVPAQARSRTEQLALRSFPEGQLNVLQLHCLHKTALVGRDQPRQQPGTESVVRLNEVGDRVRTS